MLYRRFAFLFACVAASAVAWAQETYMGLYLMGSKIGYTYSAESDDKIAGKPMRKFVSKTVMDAEMLGSALHSVIDQTSWTTPSGQPTLLKFVMESGGRTQRVEANFFTSSVRLVVDNNGAKTTKTLAFPKDAPIVDDAINALVDGRAGIGAKRSFYVLDPTTLTFVKNVATLKGQAKIDVDGKSVTVTQIIVAEPRLSMTVSLNAKGDLVLAEASGGITLRPLSKEEAMAVSEGGVTADIAEATKIDVSPPLGTSSDYKTATFRFEGGDFSRAPRDSTQQIRVDGKNWIVQTNPAQPNMGGTAITIAQAAKAKPQWTESSLNIPAKDPSLSSVAQKAIGSEKGAVRAAKRIGAFVYRTMRPNAGIGVLRDAREVLHTREGVCRDYATLTASLLRSAKLPARLASGLVYVDGAFYYHAWVESWDGTQWYGIDATRPNLDVTVGHIKLAQGSVEDAFLFTFLDRVKASVVSKTHK